MFSSIYCTQPGTPVVRHFSDWVEGCEDPEPLKSVGLDRMAREIDSVGFWERYREIEGASWVEAGSLGSWLQAWVEGRNLWVLGLPEGLREEDEQEPYLA